MNDSDNIKMYLNIGDQRVIVDATFAEQDHVRDVERKVDRLFRQLRIAYPGRANIEIMAMVAYKFGWFYENLRGELTQAQSEVSECLRMVEEDAKAAAESEDYFVAPDPSK